MAKITRVTQKVFGSDAGLNQIGQFGSFAAGGPTYTTDPALIQSLSAYLTGWFGAVLGNNSPAIEDRNALDYLFARQLANIFQTGIPEYDAGTTYYIGSFVSDGVNGVYFSIADTNVNNPLTDTTKWARFGVTRTASLNPATQSPYAITIADMDKTFLVNSALAATTFTLPAASTVPNLSFQVKDVGGNVSVNAITVQRNGTDAIEGYGGNFTCAANYGTWKFVSDGAGWWLI